MMNQWNKPPLGSQIDPAHPLSRGLVGWWLMNEGTGNKIRDLSGNENNGVLTNGPLWAPGRNGPAISFDGSDDYVDAGSKTSINNLTVFTWSAWIYPTDWGQINYGRIMGKGTIGGYDKAVFLNGLSGQHNLWMNYRNTTGSDYYSSTKQDTIVLNNWYQIAATFNVKTDKKVHLYINGFEPTYTQQSAIVGTPFVDTPYNLLIGNRGNADRTFAGLIDNVCIWNRGLSAQEIRSLYVNPYGFIWEHRQYWLMPQGVTIPPHLFFRRAA